MSSTNLGVTSWFLPVRGASALSWASHRGFGLVHIDMTDVAIAGTDALLEGSRKLGVTLAGLAVNPLEDIGVDGRPADETVDVALTAARALGISYVYLPSFGAADIESADDIRSTAQLLRYAVDRASEAGIVIATENGLPADDLAELVELVDRDELELLFDTQNLSLRGINPVDVIDRHRSRITSFAHVKDGADALGQSRLGAGSSNVGCSIAALLASGFQGTFVVENDYRTASETDVAADIRWLRETMLTLEGQLR